MSKKIKMLDMPGDLPENLKSKWIITPMTDAEAGWNAFIHLYHTIGRYGDFIDKDLDGPLEPHEIMVAIASILGIEEE